MGFTTILWARAVKHILLALMLMLSMTASGDIPILVTLTAHDAAGRTRTAAALLNSAQYSCGNGCVLAVDYSTDQLFCSAFGP